MGNSANLCCEAPAEMETSKVVDIHQQAIVVDTEPLPTGGKAKGRTRVLSDHDKSVGSDSEGENVDIEPFTISLRRRGKKLGLMLYSQGGETCLRVEVVRDGCAAYEWNRANPQLAIKPGDAILEVNGQRDPDDMRWLFQEENVDTLKIQIRPDSRKRRKS
mmetsp:Transcript_25128/g.46081  ORF Transcript_25128/g.46081 Transcript_25128/m.46081 type:complete len:161 (-) Transcript_25128:76-558(-)